MLLYYMLCYILFIPIIIANSNMVSSSTEKTVKSGLKPNKTNTPLVSEGGPILLQTNLSLVPVAHKENKTNTPMPSEGGPIIIQTTITPVRPKEDPNSLLNLEELDQHVASSPSKISARKGVDYKENNTSIHPKSSLRQDTTTNRTSYVVANNTKNLTTSSPDISKATVKINKTSTPIPKPLQTHTEKTIPKKPLILSYDKLAMDQATPIVPKIPVIQTSSKSVVADQLPTPSKVQAPVTSSSITNRHPEMVIPVVITMIVMPLFALLGYMALKRGKEAWKNRHYKRMDFLLDGMYND